MALHLAAIVRDKVILSRSEQVLAIFPGSRNERDAARERFEDTNRGYSGQRAGVRPPRNVNGDAIAREDFRHAVIREPAAILDTGARQ